MLFAGRARFDKGRISLTAFNLLLFLLLVSTR
jgi:hypothetical protein